MSPIPQLSLITVTWNAALFLERTLQSVEAALRKAPAGFLMEYILVDGASTDGTLQLAERYRHLGMRVVSEPDQGLYDAMNKGLRMASGRYVWFLNAGDELHDAEVLARLAVSLEAQADVYYSDAMFVRPDGAEAGLRSVVTPHRLPEGLTWRDMALGMKVCHQAFIARTSLAPAYDIGNLSADLDWEIRCLRSAGRVRRLDYLLCRYLLGGLSVQRHRRSLVDRWKVLRRHFGLLPALFNHLRIFCRGVWFLVRRGRYW